MGHRRRTLDVVVPVDRSARRADHPPRHTGPGPRVARPRAWQPGSSLSPIDEAAHRLRVISTIRARRPRGAENPGGECSLVGGVAPHGATTNEPGVDAVSTTTTTGRRHRSPREGPNLATLVTLLPDGRPAGAASPNRSAPCHRMKLSSMAGPVTWAVPWPVTASRPCHVEHGVAPAAWRAGLARCAT